MEKNISVFELVNYLKNKNEQDPNLFNVSITGELSNVKVYPSQHMYFDLKDDKAKLNGVMFSSATKNLNFKPVAGDKVIIKGSIKVYQNNATFQIIATKIEKDGFGDLFVQFEKNKKELEQKGYFKQEHKKVIPKMPSKIAVIAGHNSAALKDILTTLNTRFKLSSVVVFPSLVQGNEAAKSLIKMINIVNNYDFDVILLARGGGSFEDLNAFNDVDLAMSIFNSKIPIVSGVGHEIDFTIADFVSDFRATTPTAAAIKVSPNTNDIIDELISKQNRLKQLFFNKLELRKNQVDRLSNSTYLKNYSFFINEKKQILDYSYINLNTIYSNNIKDIKRRLEEYKYRLEKNNIKYKVQTYKQKNYEYYLRLNNIMESNMNLTMQKLITTHERLTSVFNENNKHIKQKVNENIIRLNLLDPNNIIGKGYAIVYQDDKLLKDFKLLKKNDQVKVVGKDYYINAKVDEVKENGK